MTAAERNPEDDPVLLRAELDACRTEIDRLRGEWQAIDRLIVSSDGPDVLVVDAEMLMQDDNDVRYWRLVEVGHGAWLHGPSGEVGALGEHLRSLAAVYRHRAEP